ncbi:MAG: hypothetical protein LBP59_00655 [Planctomycetaceae bacterium]|nr:hypothetical protein [Planctomycetaceae bacterium]
MLSLAGQIFIVTINLFHTPYNLYCSHLKFSDLKASKPAVRKLGRRR